MRTETCQTCRAWEAETDSFGSCHRLAPSGAVHRGDYGPDRDEGAPEAVADLWAAFPRVRATDWCRQWEQLPGGGA